MDKLPNYDLNVTYFISFYCVTLFSQSNHCSVIYSATC